ncbi:hypothetical protein Dsin_011664 [Dipteronia sinensis]|uniref:Uncharacterized protein n=1 Tax=Dipteronia sinensis TaxID=43782 RepID=A0AAE0AHV3_9ROSI|nr:hypothetical protein Dsin_011664 [Dipteronia sinensis]
MCVAYCKSRQRWAVCELRFPNSFKKMSLYIISKLLICLLNGIGSFQNDVILLHAIEADLGKQLEEFECKEQEVFSDIKRIFNASCVAKMNLMDFDEKAKELKKQKMKTLAEKGLLKKRVKKIEIYVD